LLRFLSQFNNILVYVLLGAGFVKLMLNLWIDAAIILGVVIKPRGKPSSLRRLGWHCLLDNPVAQDRPRRGGRPPMHLGASLHRVAHLAYWLCCGVTAESFASLGLMSSSPSVYASSVYAPGIRPVA